MSFIIHHQHTALTPCIVDICKAFTTLSNTFQWPDNDLIKAMSAGLKEWAEVAWNVAYQRIPHMLKRNLKPRYHQNPPPLVVSMVKDMKDPRFDLMLNGLSWTPLDWMVNGRLNNIAGLRQR